MPLRSAPPFQHETTARFSRTRVDYSDRRGEITDLPSQIVRQGVIGTANSGVPRRRCFELEDEASFVPLVLLTSPDTLRGCTALLVVLIAVRSKLHMKDHKASLRLRLRSRRSPFALANSH